MNVRAIKTDKVTPGDDLLAIIDAAIDDLSEASVVAVTSKIISLCQNRVVPLEEASKNELIIREADYYLPKELSKYGHHFTITNNTLIASAGIDESNGGDYYVLWPEDSFTSANEIRQHLTKRFGLKKVGVIIVDSTCSPMRRGAAGIALAWSGFKALNNYVGKPDLFGRPFSVSQAAIAGGLAATAVLAMGEGSEQTPLAVIDDIPFVQFQDRNPIAEEIAEINISAEDDLFAPFLKSVEWRRAKHSK